MARKKVNKQLKELDALKKHIEEVNDIYSDLKNKIDEDLKDVDKTLNDLKSADEYIKYMESKRIKYDVDE